jgi:hypothetical protein
MYAYWIDWERYSIVVRTDQGPAPQAVENALAPMRDRAISVRVEPSGPIRGRVKQLIGGEGLGIGNTDLCTLGFNVERPTEPGVFYGLTAGHCGTGPVIVASDRGTFQIGDILPQNVSLQSNAALPPGNDVAAVRYRSRLLLPPPFNQFGQVEIHPAVYSRTTPAPGGGFIQGSPLPVQSTPSSPLINGMVCSTGFLAGVSCGRVTSLTLRTVIVDARGTVLGRAGNQIGTTTCAFSGDSGAALYSAPFFVFQDLPPYGTLSGSTSGSCTVSTSFNSTYQPIGASLAALNMRLISSFQYPINRVILP